MLKKIENGEPLEKIRVCNTQYDEKMLSDLYASYGVESMREVVKSMQIIDPLRFDGRRTTDDARLRYRPRLTAAGRRPAVDDRDGDVNP